MLLLAAAALMMPAIFELVEGQGLPGPGAEVVDYGWTVEQLSLAVAIVLIATYVAGLFFSLQDPPGDSSTPHYEEEEDDTWGWSVRTLGDRARRSPGSLVGADVGGPGRLDQRGLGVGRALASSSSA